MTARLAAFALFFATAAAAQVDRGDGGTPDPAPVEAPAPPAETPKKPPAYTRPIDPRKASKATRKEDLLPAQPERSQNAITLNLGALTQLEFGLEYERALGNWFSIYVAPKPTFLFTAGHLDVGFLAEAGVRVFLIGKPPGGLFLGPLIQVALSHESASGISRNTFAVGYGGMLGLSFVFFDRVVISGGIGARYLKLSNDPSLPVRAIPRLAVGAAF